MHCFLTTMNFGLRNGGGMGESMSSQDYTENNRSRFWIKFFFEASFHMIINVIFLNIVFGIIIDTFA